MKKLIKFIFGLVFFVIFIAIILVVVVSILLFDNSHNGEKVEATTEEVVSNLNYNALETAKSDSTLSYTFDVLTLNSLLGSISNSIQLDPLKINNMYATFDNLEDTDETNDTITLYVPLKVYFYETCLIATANVTDNDESFTLTISQAKVGKVDSNFFLIKTAMEKAFNPDVVEEQLAKQGFTVECAYNDGNFSLTMQNDDVLDFLIDNIGDNALYKTLIDIIKENPSLYNIDFSGEKKGFVINLNTLSSTIDSSKSFEAISNPETNAIAKAETLLEKGIIDSKQTPYVVDYLIRGYANVEEETQNIVKKINMTSIGITYVESHPGIVVRNDVDMVNIIASSITSLSSLIPGNANVDFTDDNVNAIIDDQKILGKTFTFQKDNSINYITIGNIYITTSYHQILLTTLVDLNGKEVKMDITLDASTVGNDFSLTTTLKKVEIGSVSFNDSEQKTLLEFLEKNAESDFLQIDPSTKTIIFDFSTYFENDSLAILKTLEDHISKEIEVLDGKIEVRLIPTL